MSFLAPITGLIALSVGVGAVLLFYMLRLRRRPIGVSSTLLWSKSVKDMEGNIPWQRLSPTILLWVHLLIVLLFSFAIAQPVFGDRVFNGQRVYIVLDTSASMSAMYDGKSGIDRAKEESVQRVNELFSAGSNPIVTIVESSDEARVILRDAQERGRVISMIRSIQGTDLPGRVYDGIDLVDQIEAQRLDSIEHDQEEEEDVSIESDSVVLVISDDDSHDRVGRLLEHGFGEIVVPNQGVSSIGNIGIVELSAMRDRSERELCRLFVSIERNESGSQGVVLGIRMDGVEIHRQAISMGDDEYRVSETIELMINRGGELSIELSSQDVLSSDDRAWIMIPDPGEIRIVIVAPDGNADPVLVDMLEAVALTRAQIVDQEFKGSADLVVYDRVTPMELGRDPTLGFGCDFEGDQPRIGGGGDREFKLRTWDREDFMIRDSMLNALRYRKRVEIDESEEDRVLARDQFGSVISERTIDQARHIRVGFALHDSNWGSQVGFPIFLSNVFDRLLPGFEGVGRVVRTKDLRSIGMIESENSRVGYYDMNEGRVGVSLLDRHESIIRAHESRSIGSKINIRDSDRSDGIGSAGLWRWGVLGCIVLLCVDWIVYLKKSTL